MWYAGRVSLSTYITASGQWISDAAMLYRAHGTYVVDIGIMLPSPGRIAQPSNELLKINKPVPRSLELLNTGTVGKTLGTDPQCWKVQIYFFWERWYACVWYAQGGSVTTTCDKQVEYQVWKAVHDTELHGVSAERRDRWVSHTSPPPSKLDTSNYPAHRFLKAPTVRTYISAPHKAWDKLSAH